MNVAPKKKKSTSKPDIMADYSHQQIVEEDAQGSDEDSDEDLAEPTDGLAVEAEAPRQLPAVGAALPSVVSRDALKAYMREISKYALLTPEEEMDLTLRMRNANDMDAARRLVCANLRLVVKLAMEYHTTYGSVMDLIQEGNFGLMKAVSKFDPSKGAKLSYYASWWIRSYILKYILDNFRLVKLGTTQAQKKLFYQLMRERERLEAQGLDAGPKLLADRLNVREKDVVEMSQRLSGAGAEMSLQAPLNRGEDGEKVVSHQDQLVDAQALPDDRLAEGELKEVLKEGLEGFVKTLKEKELAVFHGRLAAEDPKTLQEIADKFGLTRERARQIEVKVIEKLRAYYQDRMK